MELMLWPSTQANQVTGVSQSFPAINSVNKFQKTSTDANLFHSFICTFPLINHALTQLQARIRVFLAHGSLLVSGPRTQSFTFPWTSTTANFSATTRLFGTICSVFSTSLRARFILIFTTRRNTEFRALLYDPLKAHSAWRNVGDWMDKMEATFLTSYSRTSFRPRASLQNCKIDPSTEINDYSVLKSRGWSLQRTALLSPCLVGAEECVSRATCLVGAKEGRLRVKMSTVHFSSKLQSIDLQASRFKLQLHGSQQLKVGFFG